MNNHPIAAVPIASASVPWMMVAMLVTIGYAVLVVAAVWNAWLAKRARQEVVLIILSWVTRWLLTTPFVVFGAGTAASIIGWIILYGTILVDAAVRRWVPEDVRAELRSRLKRP